MIDCTSKALALADEVALGQNGVSRGVVGLDGESVNPCYPCPTLSLSETIMGKLNMLSSLLKHNSMSKKDKDYELDSKKAFQATFA
jgi:hypothetical protein